MTQTKAMWGSVRYLQVKEVLIETPPPFFHRRAGGQGRGEGPGSLCEANGGGSARQLAQAFLSPAAGTSPASRRLSRNDDQTQALRPR